MTTRDHLIATPFAGCPPEIGRALWALQETRKRTLAILQEIKEVGAAILVDWRSPHERHSLGTLLYHLAAVEADWLYVEVLEIDFPPEMQVWFPFDMRDTDGLLTTVTKQSLGLHLQRLAAVREALLATFSAMPAADFARPRALPRYDVTPEWVAFHLTQHEAEHRTEIASLHNRFKTEKFQTTGE